jgi:hypothetical protein
VDGTGLAAAGGGASPGEREDAADTADGMRIARMIAAALVMPTW